MTARTYGSPETFKRALEQRLRSAAANGPDFARRHPEITNEGMQYEGRVARDGPGHDVLDLGGPGCGTAG